MKSKFFRVLAAVMAIVMMVTCFAACGEKEKEEAPTKASTISGPDDSSTTTETTTEGLDIPDFEIPEDEDTTGSDEPTSESGTGEMDMPTQEEMTQYLNMAGYAYDPDQNLYYSTLNPWQRHMGFGSEYDELAVYANMRYRTIKVDFEYDGLLWRIQCWKGQYGVLAGGEMGVYTKDPNDVSTTFYECASDEHLLEMSFKFYKTVSDFNKKNLSFERELQEHWWLTGFKFGYCSSNSCVMIMTFKMFDTAMADGFEEGLKNVVDLKGNWCGFVEESNRTSTTTDFYKRSGNVFQVCWVLAGFNNYTNSGEEIPEEDMQQ